MLPSMQVISLLTLLAYYAHSRCTAATSTANQCTSQGQRRPWPGQPSILSMSQYILIQHTQWPWPLTLSYETWPIYVQKLKIKGPGFILKSQHENSKLFQDFWGPDIPISTYFYTFSGLDLRISYKNKTCETTCNSLIVNADVCKCNSTTTSAYSQQTY